MTFDVTIRREEVEDARFVEALHIGVANGDRAKAVNTLAETMFKDVIEWVQALPDRIRGEIMITEDAWRNGDEEGRGGVLTCEMTIGFPTKEVRDLFLAAHKHEGPVYYLPWLTTEQDEDEEDE